MPEDLWQKLLIPQQRDDALWELFHENSKLGRYTPALSDEEVRSRMASLYESLPYEGYPIVALPQPLTSFPLSLADTLAARLSTRNLVPVPLSLEVIATLLYYAYGVTRSNDNTNLPRPFRAVPSGGALYPLEFYIHSAQIANARSGLYHYNPTRNHLRLLKEGDATETISQSLVQPEIGTGVSLIIFITALFERSTFKYGDRGYRFVLLEAGHAAQNMSLVSTALGLGCVNLGGFFDREVDTYLELDGLTHSTVYMLAIGGKPIPIPTGVPS
jgi:SagB-type dehydrogenase family enzyme